MARVCITDGQWCIQCPACKYQHGFIPGRWTFNNDFEKPTFSPSMMITVNPKDHKHHNPNAATTVCHSVIRDGRIEFLNDCTHHLKGQTVDLPDIEGFLSRGES
jgi:hypothetical protein